MVLKVSEPAGGIDAGPGGCGPVLPPGGSIPFHTEPECNKLQADGRSQRDQGAEQRGNVHAGLSFFLYKRLKLLKYLYNERVSDF